MEGERVYVPDEYMIKYIVADYLAPSEELVAVGVIVFNQIQNQFSFATVTMVREVSRFGNQLFLKTSAVVLAVLFLHGMAEHQSRKRKISFHSSPGCTTLTRNCLSTLMRSFPLSFNFARIMGSVFGVETYWKTQHQSRQTISSQGRKKNGMPIWYFLDTHSFVIGNLKLCEQQAAEVEISTTTEEIYCRNIPVQSAKEPEVGEDIVVVQGPRKLAPKRVMNKVNP